MRRLVYQPRIQAFIKCENLNTIVDITEDIVSGSVNRRLNALSDATIVLQNKNAKYTASAGVLPGDRIPKQRAFFRPMDRIVIFMSRMSDLFPVFSGYIDEAPYYQLYPGTVTLKASCTLKLLQNTYFDPGLPFMQSFMQNFGIYDPSTGILTNNGAFGNFDVNHGIGKVLYQVLTDIGQWNQDSVHIKPLPQEFLNSIFKFYIADLNAEQADLTQLKKYLESVYSLDGVSADTISFNGSAPGNPQPSLTPGTVLGSGVLAAAAAAINAGFSGSDLVTAVAIAGMESSFNANSGAGSQVLGMWQINIASGAHPLPITITPINATTPVTITSANQLLDPTLNAQVAYDIYLRAGRQFGAWQTYTGTPGGGAPTNAQGIVTHSRLGDPATWNIYIQQATQAINKEQNHLNTPNLNTTVNINTPTTWQIQDGTAPMSSGQTSPYSNISFNSGVDWVHISPTLLNLVNQVASSDNVKVTVTSGYRSLAYERQIGVALTDPGGGQVLDPHTRGLAIDAYVNGTPITQVHPLIEDLVKQGVRNGSTFTSPVGTNPGQPDVEHIDLMNAAGTAPSSIITGNGYVGTVATGTNTTTPVAASGSIGGVSLTSDLPITASQAAAIANKLGSLSAFTTLQLQTNDSSLSVLLTGKRALSNDIPLMEWINQMVQSSGRVFTSSPNGDFYCFFPDYFGWFKRTPYFKINETEIVDLQIQVSDQSLATHVYTTGPLLLWNQISPMDKTLSSVASVQEDAFDQFIQISPEDPLLDPTADTDADAFARYLNNLRAGFDPIQFLTRFGARPFVNDLPEVRNPVLIWMAGWMKFSELWAQMFSTQASFTFMPELFPGGIVNIGDRITMFINSVSHTFDMESGFNTSAELVAPASLNGDFFGMPISRAASGGIPEGADLTFR